MRWASAIAPALLLPAVAAADIGITRVVPQTARPGQAVTITVSGYLGQRPWRPMPVVLVAASRAPKPYPCPGGICTPGVLERELRKRPYRLLGNVRRWRDVDDTGVNAVGVLTARIPRVRPGRYLLGLFCASCIRGPKGSVIIGYRLVVTVRR